MPDLMIFKGIKNILIFSQILLEFQDLNCYPPEIQIEIIDKQHQTTLNSKYKKLISVTSDLNYVPTSNFTRFDSQILL